METHYHTCDTCGGSNKKSEQNDPDQDLKCDTCGQKILDRKYRSARSTLAFALTALVFYIPANLFPFMTFEMYGNRSEATIWSGIVSLADNGVWFIAVIVFVASMLIPLFKIAALAYLGFTAKNGRHQVFKTKLYYFVEAIGRWSMLDIFLLAVLIAVMKFDNLASVAIGAGSLMFLFVVIFSLLASESFDTKLIWEGDVHGKQEQSTTEQTAGRKSELPVERSEAQAENGAPGPLAVV